MYATYYEGQCAVINNGYLYTKLRISGGIHNLTHCLAILFQTWRFYNKFKTEFLLFSYLYIRFFTCVSLYILANCIPEKKMNISTAIFKDFNLLCLLQDILFVITNHFSIIKYITEKSDLKIFEKLVVGT